MMTAEQLKGSILQLAMQGKLVEQRPDEGTGEELYKEIQTEKKRLLKEGTLKKQKPLPEITEEEKPFDIPESWIWVKLGDISSYAQPKEKVSPKDITPEMWSLDLEDIEKGTGKVLNHVLARERKIQGDKVRFKKGNILYSKLRPYLLKILIADNEGITTPELVPFNIYGIKNSNFFLWYLRSPYVDNAVNSVSYGVKMPRVGTDTMINLLVPIPPLAEQKRIVAKIEELMPLVEQYAAASTKLNTLNASFPEMMKKSILQEAVQGKLVPQDPNDEPASLLLKKIRSVLPNQKPCKDDLNFDSMEFELPDKWEWAELNQLFDFVDYRGKTPHKIDKGVFLITASNIKQGFMEYTRKEYISEEEYKDRQSRGITNRGDLLFTTEAPMGNAAICDLEKCSCGQRIITFKPFYEGTVIPELFMFFILSPCFQQQLLNNCTGTTAKGIKADKLKHFKIPLPPIKEQSRILKRIKEAMPLIYEL